MLVIGVTGNIGSGKSSVCRILARLGATVLDADELAHETYNPHSEVWQELVAAFGTDILMPGEEIDRQKLGQAVFSDPAALARLNRIVHPAARRLAQERIADCRLQGARAVALEATLLIEAGWAKLVDRLWLVIAAESTAVRRLRESQGMDEHQVLARLKAQMPANEKMEYADDIIYNDGNLSQLKSQVTELWHKLQIA
ncbi:MAG: dephospho-CoA kinase [Dehalococcoidia bacterium]|nr:dephospho-CoA kinase [Dehalococcoidia bacterium]